MDHEVMSRRDLEEFRGKVKEVRAKEWRRDALLLRDKTPEETIRVMFDLVNFAEKINRAKKCEP